MATSTERALVGVCDEEIPISYATSWQCNKFGGQPDWMYPSSKYPECIACGVPMYLVAQLYCPLEAVPYHRIIYIFTCIRKTCLNKRESWRVFRSQLPVTSLPREGAKQEAPAMPKAVSVATDEWCEDADDWGSESDEENPTEWLRPSTATNSAHIRGESEPCLAFQLNPKITNQTIDFAGEDDKNNDSVAMETHASMDAGLSHSGNALWRSTESDDVVGKGGVSCEKRSKEDAENAEELKELTSDCESRNRLDNVSLALPWDHSAGQRPIHPSTVGPASVSENADATCAMEKLSITCTRLPSTAELSRSAATDPPSFQAYFVSVFDEPIPRASVATQLTNHERELMAEYQRREGVDLLEWQEQHLQTTRISSGDESYEKTTAKHGDKMFEAFAKRVQLCPEQCIRYSWNGSPMYLTSPSEGDIIPPCTSCGGQLVFELQLMPALISVLRDTGLKGAVVEFGVVLVYTCRTSCWTDPPQPGQRHLREEHIVLQTDPDFSRLDQATSYPSSPQQT